MFYSQFILAKKGPLGTIWIAAHLERKLRKNQVADTDIGVSVDSILFPEMPIALRLSSHLLLGVVRIYSKKVNYLFDDCSEALLKVKQAFRATAVDLPPEETTAPYHSITLPETFDLDDFELPENDLQGSYVDQHISSKDQITLQDTMDGVVYSTSKFGLDERFGDDDAPGLDLDEEPLAEKAATPELATGASDSGDDIPQASDHSDAGDMLNQDLDDYDGDNEPVDYAQGPCTPGLWEEPNLSNVQDTSACDDHHEPENHAITESAVKENLEKVFPHESQNRSEPHEKSTPHVAETGQMIRDLGSTSFTQSLSTETVIPVSNDPSKVKELRNKKIMEGPPPGFQTAHNNRENFVEYQGSQNPGVQSGNDGYGNFAQYQGNQQNTFHLTSELESNSGKDNLVGTPQHHSSFEPKDASTPVLFTNDSMPNSNFPSLRPCVTFMNHETTAEGQHANEALNRSFPELHHAEIDQNNHQVRVDNVIQREVQVESINNYTNDFSAPVTQREVQVENINTYANDFPAPEKRLSLPHWLSDVPKSFVPESTPIEKDITSGKKRSFAESSMTDHTLNLNESSGFFNTHMTPQSLNLNASSSFYNTNTPAQSLNLNQSSGFYTTDTPAQSLNLNQSSGFFATDTTAQSQNLNQSSGFFDTNTTAQSQNLNQSSGFFNTNTTAQSQNLNQSLGFFNTNTTAQSQNLNQSSGFFNTNTTAQSQNLNQSSSFYTTNTTAQSQNLNQTPGFYTTNTTAQGQNLNQTPGFYTTNTTAQSQSLNQSPGFYTTNTPAQSLNLNQSSGFFPTNTTAQSLNLNQSSGPFTINMTGQSAVNDNDLLSSILVGRKTSILKTKPSLPAVTPSTKRGRPAGSKNIAPKTGVPKRKVLMDDNMVLHGDAIRQQLTNTEDIRRLRKKAPCTRSEISMLEKQFWEDEIFSEPIFTGVSIKLASLHKQLYNLSKIVVSLNDNASLEGGKDPKSISQINEKGTQLEVGPTIPKENANFEPVAQPVEFPMVTDNHTVDYNTVGSGYYGGQPPQMAATGHVAEPFTSEHDLFGERTAMEIDPKSFPGADIGVSVMPTEVEPPTQADVVPSVTFDTPAAMSEVQVDASLQTDAPGVYSTEKMDLQSVDMDINNFKSLESSIASETNIDVAPVKQVSEEKHDQDIEYRKTEEEAVNENAALGSNVESSIQNSIYSGIFGEEFGTVAAYDTEVNPVLENVSLDGRENPDHDVTFETSEMNADDTPAINRVNDDEFTHTAVENDTDFLNFDDGDDDNEADAGGDYDGTDVEATRVIDNSGWSSRTKAVAKYLQIMFDKEGERGRNMVSVNNLLVGKTRKEASRMFFETLVLKTKDYIHVEQADPFENINVFPRAKLLKSDF